MNREIKFRAWCESNKEMYYPDNIYEFHIDNNSVGFYPNYDKEEHFSFNTIPSEHEKQIIVMQYTGLKDKNGKEIYEGDILNFGNNNYVQVIFDNGSFNVFDEPLGWDFDSDIIPIKTDFRYCEVIGNICENPELLK